MKTETDSHITTRREVWARQARRFADVLDRTAGDPPDVILEEARAAASEILDDIARDIARETQRLDARESRDRRVLEILTESGSRMTASEIAAEGRLPLDDVERSVARLIAAGRVSGGCFAEGGYHV